MIAANSRILCNRVQVGCDCVVRSEATASFHVGWDGERIGADLVANGSFCDAKYLRKLGDAKSDAVLIKDVCAGE